MLISCSNCQSKIKVPDSAAGKKGKCPKCGTIITIPLAEEPVAEPPAAAAPAPAPFDFGDEPAAPKAGGRKPVEPEEDAVEEAPPPRPRKSAPREDEEEDELPEPYEDAEAEEDEGRGGRKKKKAGESIGLSVTSLVLGIVSLVSGGGGFCCCLFAPVSLLCAIGAVVTGLLGMNKGGKVMAIVGMSLGGLSLLLALAGIVVGIVWGGLNMVLQQAHVR